MYLIALLLLMAFSGLGYTSCVSGKVFDFLGKMSMPIFCIHWGVYKYIESFAPGIDYRVGILLAFAVSFVLSLIMSVLLDLRHKRAL